jgi:hypothetical protein
VQPDYSPTWDDAAIDRMLRLKQALDDGNYDKAFDKLFPPGDSGEQPAGE